MILVEIRPKDGAALLVLDRVEMRRGVNQRNVVLQVSGISKHTNIRRQTETHAVHVDELCEIRRNKSRILDI